MTGEQNAKQHSGIRKAQMTMRQQNALKCAWLWREAEKEAKASGNVEKEKNARERAERFEAQAGRARPKVTA